MPLLDINGIRTAYENKVEVLHKVSITVEEGELVTLIGSNGAGKSTTLKAIMGLTRITGGAIRFQGRDLHNVSTPDIASLGISMVPEGRGVFPSLSVYDNLRIATTPWRKTGESFESDLEAVYGLFPVLAKRHKQLGWSLSGGEQQMLAIGRALVARPKLMLLDEPSLGLAPILVEQLFETLKRINDQGVSILLVEQNAFMALEISDRAYVLERGAITAHDRSGVLMDDESIKIAYLGG